MDERSDAPSHIPKEGDDRGEYDSDNSESSEDKNSPALLVNPSECDDAVQAQQVRAWSERVPIGMGFCPWAVKSKHLSYRICEATSPEDVVERVRQEARHLLSEEYADAPLSSTLLVCPQMPAWQDDFDAFDRFVKSLLIPGITFVAFHPQFLRWRGLPPNITEGSLVQSHRNSGGLQKTQETFPATILETTTIPFGRRKVRVRFHSDGQAQYVPVDWLRFKEDTTPTASTATLGTPLPDNLMHRAPFPTIHLIRDGDLAFLPMRSVSRVKRKNAQRMTQLGWEGMTNSTE